MPTISRHAGSVLFGVCIGLALALPAPAGLPEPDNVVYGDLVWPEADGPRPLAGVRVTAHRVESNGSLGAELARYTIGDRVEAGEKFVVRVRVDAGDVPRPGALRVGERFRLAIDGAAVGDEFVAGSMSDAGSLFRQATLAIDPSMYAGSNDVLGHLLGIRPLEGVKRATADANADGRIDAVDLAVLRTRGR